MSYANAKSESSDTYNFTKNHFEKLRRLVGEQTGISLGDQKRDLLYGRLTRRLRVLGLSNFDEYCNLLEQSPEVELQNFINAVTTNLTSFFREQHHFDYLENDWIPALKESGQLQGARIWSAGCSTGEEAYSIAMCLQENIPDIDRLNITITATDLDTAVVQTGANGVYDEKRIEGMSDARRKRWFLKGVGSNRGKVRVRQELRKMVSFSQLNLMKPWPMNDMFDVVFCRNVVIYFDKPTQQVLFKRFADVIKPKGHLFIGHSETLHKISDQFDLIGKTIYRKLD